MPLKWGLFYSVSHWTFFRLNSCENPTHVVSWEVVFSSCHFMSNTSNLTDGSPPVSLLCSRDFWGMNTGMGCPFLLQEIFLTQGSNQFFCITGVFFIVELGWLVTTNSIALRISMVVGLCCIQLQEKRLLFFIFSTMDQFSFLLVEPQTIYLRLTLLLLSTCVVELLSPKMK